MAKAQPVRVTGNLGGEEGFEHAFENFGRDAAAAIGDRDLHIIAGRDFGAAVSQRGVDAHIAGLDGEWRRLPAWRRAR